MKPLSSPLLHSHPPPPPPPRSNWALFALNGGVQQEIREKKRTVKPPAISCFDSDLLFIINNQVTISKALDLAQWTPGRHNMEKVEQTEV